MMIVRDKKANTTTTTSNNNNNNNTNSIIMMKRNNSQKNINNGKKKQKQQKQNQQLLLLDELLVQIDKYIQLDQILEARKIIDIVLEDESSLGVLLTSSQHSKLQNIVIESNHVTSLLNDITSDESEGWILAKQKHGVTVHYRHEQNSPIHAVKTRYVFEDVTPDDFVHLVSVFNESDLMPLWFPNNVLKEVIPLAKPSNYHQILQMKINMGRLSPISPRDAVLDGHGYHLCDRNAIIVFSKSITESPYVNEIPKPELRTIRMETRNAFFVQLLPNKRMVFCQISHDDLKLKYMPSWLLNYIAEGAIPFEVIQNLKKCLKNFDGSIWSQRINARRDVYEEIENRLADELEIINNKQEQFSTSGAGRATGGEGQTMLQQKEYDWIKNLENNNNEEETHQNPPRSSVVWNITIFIIALAAAMYMITKSSSYNEYVDGDNITIVVDWKQQLFIPAFVVTIIVTQLLSSFLRRRRRYQSQFSSANKVKSKTSATAIQPAALSLQQQQQINTSSNNKNTSTTKQRNNDMQQQQRTLPPSMLSTKQNLSNNSSHREQQHKKSTTAGGGGGVKRIIKKVVLVPVGIVKYPIKKIQKQRKKRHQLHTKMTNSTTMVED